MRLALILCFLACCQIAGAETGQPELSWLAGRWVGQDRGNQIVEIWLPPALDGMMGVSEMLFEGKQQHREFLWFEATPEGARLRVAWPTEGGLRIREFSQVDLSRGSFLAHDRQYPGETLRYQLLPSGELEIVQTDGNAATHRLLLHRDCVEGPPSPREGGGGGWGNEAPGTIVPMPVVR